MPQTQKTRIRLLCLVPLCALLLCATATQAQQSWPAYVTAERAPVYRDMDKSSTVMTTLLNGSQVTVYFAVQSTQGSWCKIALQDDRQNYGFVLCSQLHRGQPPSADGSAPGSSAATGGPSLECKELVDGLMAASGADAEFILFSKEAIAAIGERQTPRLTAQQRADFVAIIQREMDGLVLGAEVHRGLLKRCDPAIYLAALDTFKSPVVARMLRLETTPGNAAGALDGSSPGPPERVALFRRLDRAQHHTQFLVDLSTSMVAVMSSVLAGQTPSQAQVDSLRNQMHQRLQPLLLAINAAVYRSVSDEELTQYVTVWESSPLRQYNAIYQRVLADVMTTQSRIVDEDLKAKLEFYRPRTAAP